MAPLISIVIVNYNVKFFLEQCLFSVRKAAEGIDTEIFVVDNASTDGSQEYIVPKFPEVKYIYNEKNTGFAVANNRAIKDCSGKYILLLNPDTVIGEKCLADLLAFMEEHSEAGAAGVKMIDAMGQFLPESKRSFPTPWSSFCKIFGLSRRFPRSRFFSAYNLLYLDPDKIHKVDVLAGAFMFIRKTALEEAGLFDEAFFMYGEDIDLSFRLQLSGYCNYYLPCPILHYKGESSKQGKVEYVENFYGAMLIFFRKYYNNAGFLISALIRLAITMKRIQAKRPGRNRKPSLSASTTLVYPEMSFDKIIRTMDASCGKKTIFRIHNKYTDIIITPTI